MRSIIDELKRGRIPSFIKTAAHEEGVHLNYLIKNIVRGRIVILRNNVRQVSRVCCIGKGLTPKINVNIGTSTDERDLKDELVKLKTALKYGADTVMDLSVGGDLRFVREKILQKCPVPLGTVPIYEAAVYAQKRYKSISKMKVEEIFSILEEQARQGVDFFTIHACITRRVLKVLEENKRIMPIVSRGGAILAKWIRENDRENPFYERFDRVMQICKKYDITISIGDSLRPGCLDDATDEAQLTELFIAGELIKRCREEGVQVIMEGPGHVPLHQVETNVILEKRICDEAPFYILGPLVIDIAPGYDHIGSSIGGALALWKGADFFCVVTPAEHLRHPTVEDIRQGTIAARIAAHAASIARSGKISARDTQISVARANRDWHKQKQFALDRERIGEFRNSSLPSEDDVCTMCGKYCSLKIADTCITRKKKLKRISEKRA